ncbi:MAG TPA: helix-turn-helix domain-containing protein, partial [Ktedonobacteraceae bacterium]|nr:helix-turn-helix domain-containing protein [Ktedonobacteraceae bacterium]
MTAMQDETPSEKKANQPNILLRRAREARGWSQSDLATLLGAGESTIRNWENGRSFPGPFFQDQLCQIFQLPPERLGLQLKKSIAEKECSPNVIALPSQVALESTEHMKEDEDGLRTPPSPIKRFLSYREQDTNRRRMIQRVRNIWIDGMLRTSLGQMDLVSLQLVELPEALANPWQPAIQEMARPARMLPSGTSLLQVYDIAEGKFLLLGEPGAGKTTLLLALTDKLLSRAEQERKYPIPVIFNLTSWQREQLPLAEWLREELWIKYQVPRNIGQQWLEGNQLALFLDGLDETSNEACVACIQAISAYYQEHPSVSLVICSRTKEYFAQRNRFALRSAVLVQPLSHEQIDLYLTNAGEQLETVRQTLLEDKELLETSTNPLMLSIVVMTYGGENSTPLPRVGSIETRRREIFATYVRRMLERRGAQTNYSAEETIH